MNKFIRVERADLGIATLMIDRPETLNALNREVITELKAELTALGQDESVRVIILRGAGEKSFIAGADIKAMQELNRGEAADLGRLAHSVCLMLESMKKVTIAAVHGFALGGGLEFALSCDFILASDKAQFGLPEVSLGVIPGFGGTFRLARAVGTAIAKELIFSALRFNATEAKDLGLIRKVYPQDQFFTEVHQVAEKISKHSLSAVISAKKLLNEFEETVGVHPKSDAEIHQFSALFEGPDQAEGMLAFTEKRPAKFKGL